MDDTEKDIMPFLSRQFDVDAKDDWHAFYDALVKQLDFLINYKLEQLMWVLYRIDIDESKAMNALSRPQPAQNLAELIVERQIQKWKSRNNI